MWPWSVTCHSVTYGIFENSKYIIKTLVCQNLEQNTPVTFSTWNHVVLTPLVDVCGILSSTGGIRRRHGRLNRCGWAIWKKSSINTSLRSNLQSHLLVPLLTIISPLHWRRMMGTATIKNKAIQNSRATAGNSTIQPFMTARQKSHTLT